MAITTPFAQHWTFVRIGSPSLAIRGGFPGIPLTILCLGFLLFLIASTIVLALISVYLPSDHLNSNCTSEPFSPTFNVDEGVLPSGQLSTSNRAALQTQFNQWLINQNGFSHCSLDFTNANVSKCPSSRRRRRRTIAQQQEQALIRTARQVNTNCVSQQLTTTATLNCGCSCVGTCSSYKVDQLKSLLLFVILNVTFPDGDIKGGPEVLTRLVQLIF